MTELAVVTGDADVAAAFAALPLDHLFFTGSPAVGPRVAAAAAPNLVPVTLELGGKNPVVVSPDADLVRAARRIAQGRMVNGGQVCVCPDYVFVPAERADEFVGRILATWRAMFGTILTNADYCSSVNEANFDRVVGLIEDARGKGARVDTVTPAGEVLPDRATRKIAPTIVRDVDDTMRIAAEETFGPVLTVRAYGGWPTSSTTSMSGPRHWSRTGSGPTAAIPHLRAAHAQRRGGTQRLRRAHDPLRGAVRRRRTQRDGRLPRQGRLRRVQPSPHGASAATCPFTITGHAAPPFPASLRLATAAGLAMARRRTRRRLRRR